MIRIDYDHESLFDSQTANQFAVSCRMCRRVLKDSSFETRDAHIRTCRPLNEIARHLLNTCPDYPSVERSFKLQYQIDCKVTTESADALPGIDFDTFKSKAQKAIDKADDIQTLRKIAMVNLYAGMMYISNRILAEGVPLKDGDTEMLIFPTQTLLTELTSINNEMTEMQQDEGYRDFFKMYQNKKNEQ